MNFKKIEVFGFKSFADKLNIEFESGITAIVGPNGCGKSNVADSIRWVLGEQSAKTLRGGIMQDVIFNGTQNRKALSYCEVSLYFNNEGRMFDIDYNEVSITRKLYRSGESEYLINKKVCRLKDIIDLLRQTGMGKGGYSIIGQGKIDEILSSKPSDRRAIFEEATGISKFKQKKVETERKLVRTKESLVRIHDIIGELERQIGPLKKQSEAAEKYNVLHDELLSLEVNSYIHQYDSASHVKNDISKRLEAIRTLFSQKEKELSSAGYEYEKCINAISSADKDIEDLRDKQLDLTIKIEKKTGEANLNRQRVAYMHEQNERLGLEIKGYTEKYTAVVAILQDKMSQRDIIRDRITQDNDNYQAMQEQFMEVVGKISKDDDQNLMSQAEVIESMNKLAEIKANLSGLLAEKKTLATRFKVVENKLVAYETELENYEKIKSEYNHRLTVLENEKVFLERDLDELKLDMLKNAETLKGQHKLVGNLKNRLSAFETKQKLYEVMRSNMDGYQYSVKKLIQNAESDMKLSAHIEGIVARLMEVAEQFEIAIDVSLGQAAQNVITKTRENAKYLIEYLKQNKYGRATFLPIDGVRQRGLDSSELALLKTEGCFGVASDLISYDKKYESVYKSLLGRTLIVDTLDTAIAISKKQPQTLKIVTLEGDVIAPSGAMTGGSKKSEGSGILSYDRDIKDTKEAIEQLMVEIASAKSYRQSLETKEHDQNAAMKRLQGSVHSKELEILSNIENRNKIVSKVGEMNDLAEELMRENMETQGRLQFIADSEVEIDRLENLLKNQNTTVSDEMKKRYEVSDKLKKERDELSERVTALKVAIAEGNTRLTAIMEEIKRLNSEAIGLNENITKAADGIKVNNEIIDECQRDIDKSIALVSGDDRMKDIKERLQNLDVFKSELNSNLAKYDALRSDISQELTRISDNRLKEEFALEKVDIDIATMQERVMEEYQLDYESALPHKIDEFDFEGSQKDINRLRRAIGALGFINEDAIEDYKVTGSRYEDMATQRDDLIAAERDLLKIISEITAEMLKRFNEGFARISENFVTVFKELFGGGNAKLVLEPSENGDTLEDGIEIVAEPPGKKWQIISLLSGGERALTAIAILFAILMMRPMPFCVLDEIEAALDDTNADRFARYLHKFSRKTQFIVITHRKPTMELADALYGVTMEEKGVSKMVSVKLGEVIDKYNLGDDN